jgi:hypothetical protein
VLAYLNLPICLGRNLSPNLDDSLVVQLLLTRQQIVGHIAQSMPKSFSLNPWESFLNLRSPEYRIFPVATIMINKLVKEGVVASGSTVHVVLFFMIQGIILSISCIWAFINVVFVK